MSCNVRECVRFLNETHKIVSGEVILHAENSDKPSGGPGFALNPAVSSQRSPGPPSWWGMVVAPYQALHPRSRLFAQWKILLTTLWKGGFLAAEEAKRLYHSHFLKQMWQNG